MKYGKQYWVLSAIHRMTRVRKFSRNTAQRLLSERAKYSQRDAEAIAGLWFRYQFKEHINGQEGVKTMISYMVEIQRYRKTNAQMRIGEPHFIHAVDFPDAAERASLIVRGMSEADPESDFAVHSITIQGCNGERCVHGFMTQNEFSEMVKAKADKEPKS